MSNPEWWKFFELCEQCLPPGTEVTLRFTLSGDPAAVSRTPSVGTDDLGDDKKPVADSEPMKLRDVARRSGASVRELRRAIGQGLLPFTVKRYGRDAGAHMVTVGDVERYRRAR